jgi:uncharacterized Zn finger protein
MTRLMGWDYPASTDSRTLPVPEDGIVASARPLGWLGEAWRKMIESYTGDHAPRVARGRGFARAGRVRALWIAPGQATAEVVASQPYQVTIRVPVFDSRQWGRVIDVLVADLSRVAELLEGKLSSAFVAQLAERKLDLVPTRRDLEGDCDCGDFLLPCAHMVAVHYVLADALDGEPFQLLTLRGRTQEQVLGGLRRAWGEVDVDEVGETPAEEEPPEGEWTRSIVPLPALTFGVDPTVAGAGMLAMGPPPGGLDLQRAILPLYEAGAARASEILHAEPDSATEPRRRKALFVRRSELNAKDDTPVKIELPPPPPPIDITERIVDALAENEGSKSSDMARILRMDPVAIRIELIELEKLGIVYRRGRTRGTRWYLG